MRRTLLPLFIFAALALWPLTTSAATLGTETLTTSENDATNSFLSTTCNQNAANAIFTSGTFDLTGVVADSGLLFTSLFTGAAADGVAPNQVSGSANLLGTHVNGFVNYTGQLKCDSSNAGRVTSVVGILYLYDAVGSSVRVYKLNPTPRASFITLDYANQTLALDFSGTLQRVN